MRASLEADDNDNMKNFTVFFFFFCTFAALGFSGPILESDFLLGEPYFYPDYTNGRTSGKGCIENREYVCQEVNGRTQCETIKTTKCK